MAVAPGAAQAADFWIAAKSNESLGPERVVAGLTVGTPLPLYVWGRPTPGRVLRSVSLNLVASAPGIDLVDGSFAFHNDAGAGRTRFEFVLDSATVPTLISDQTSVGAVAAADSLLGINGFSLFPTAAIVGVPPTCLAAETGCLVAAGQTARPLFEFDVAGLTPLAAANLFLQVGDLGVVEYDPADGDYDYSGVVEAVDHGVWSAAYGTAGLQASDGNGDGVVNAADYNVWRDNLAAEGVMLGAAAVSVRFGVDALGGIEPQYNASANRSVTLVGDDADAVLTVFGAPSTAVPEPASFALVCAALAAGTHRRAGRVTA
ncbi:MAG: hypothetical protein ACRCT8_07930 [Lacipirellulaceae bacterium]